MISILREKCQQYVNLHIQQLVITAAWKKLPIEMQNKLKEGMFCLIQMIWKYVTTFKR